MKIAITGHTAGIGQALAKCYADKGHDIVGLSKRNGFNIRNISKMAEHIEPCDIWINNAQESFAQTELLFEMAQKWKGTKKRIIVISTQMTQEPVSLLPDLDLYRIQKISLEESVKQLRHRRLGVKFTLVRPGDIATSAKKTVPPSADVDRWASALISMLELAAPDLEISDISLGPTWP